MNRSFALALALAATGLTLSPAMASAAPQQRSASVSYSDLDLTTEQGVAELERRIDRAARSVCGLDETALGTRVRSREARECYDAAKRSYEETLAGLIREEQRGG